MVARQPDGSEVDITEGVQTLYDLVLSSMDWSSGFWTVEDALPVAVVARACGFPRVDEVEQYLAARAEDERRREEMRVSWKADQERWAQEMDRRKQAGILTAAHDRDKYDLAFHGEVTNDHAHAFMLDGLDCVWPGCTLRRTLKKQS